MHLHGHFYPRNRLILKSFVNGDHRFFNKISRGALHQRIKTNGGAFVISLFDVNWGGDTKGYASFAHAIILKNNDGERCTFSNKNYDHY